MRPVSTQSLECTQSLVQVHESARAVEEFEDGVYEDNWFSVWTIVLTTWVANTVVPVLFPLLGCAEKQAIYWCAFFFCIIPRIFFMHIIIMWVSLLDQYSQARRDLDSAYERSRTLQCDFVLLTPKIEDIETFESYESNPESASQGPRSVLVLSIIV